MAKEKVTTNQLTGRFDGLEGKFDGLSNRFDELMAFLKEHMVMRSDLENFMTKDDGRRLESRMAVLEDQQGKLGERFFVLEDHQVKLQQTIEIELIAPTLRMDRMDNRLGIVETKLGLV